MTTVTSQLIAFTQGTRFDALPERLVGEIKRGLIDALGCGLAGLTADRGKIAVRLARRMGGPPEASLIGLGDRMSVVNAAFANAELVNALDFDATPHTPPIVIPATVAIAEMRQASGRDLIAALAVGLEAAVRLNSAMSNYTKSYVEKGTSPDVFGNSNEAMLGAALAAGRLLDLDDTRLANALGLAGYFCSVPVGKDWHDVKPPKHMVKYAPTGMLAKSAVMAALLAQDGMTGNASVLDGKYGFHKFYSAGRWEPATVTEGLGTLWRAGDFQLKPYPCCRFFHAQLDCFLALIAEHELSARDIQQVEALGFPFAANAQPYDVASQSDAQFSLPYNIAVAAHGVPPGPQWQALSTIADPAIRAFMPRVKIGVDPKAAAVKAKDSKAWGAKVTITTATTTLTRETVYARGTPVEGYAMNDDDLSAKFRRNAQTLLTAPQIDRALDKLWRLEHQDTVADLMRALALS